MAVNIQVYQSGRIFKSQIFQILSSNPMSSIRSASSITRNVTLQTPKSFESSKSISLPGVANKMSMPFQS